MDTGAGCAARWTFGGGSGSLGVENDVGAVQPDPEDSDGRLGMGVIIYWFSPELRCLPTQEVTPLSRQLRESQIMTTF